MTELVEAHDLSTRLGRSRIAHPVGILAAYTKGADDADRMRIPRPGSRRMA
jgi:hypothetical protein